MANLLAEVGDNIDSAFVINAHEENTIQKAFSMRSKIPHIKVLTIKYIDIRLIG